MSFHNHSSALTQAALAAYDGMGLEDGAIGRPYPRAPADPAAFFRRWLTQGAVPGHEDGSPTVSFFHFQRSWWDARNRSNVLFVHYNDLKADLSGEMRRIAEFLDIPVTPAIWPDLVAAAGFEAMRRDGDALMSNVRNMFEGGNDRWRGIFGEEDLALYDAKVEAMLSPRCAHWLAGGRLCAGDPRPALT